MALPSFAYIVLCALPILIGCYTIFLGYGLARLIRYKGALGPQPKRYVILPPYLKERLLAEASETSSLNSNEHDTKKALQASRWRGSTLLDPNVDLDDMGLGKVRDERVKKDLLEEKRISRMPVFVQDDCGDGSLFPEIPEIDPAHFDDAMSQRLQAHLPDAREYKHPSFRKEPGNYMTMGLKKIDVAKDWLVIDPTYVQFWEARKILLAEKKEEVVRVMSEPDAVEACEELLKEVVEFLTSRYPEQFVVEERGGWGNVKKVVVNKIVNEEFPIQKPWTHHPLEVCARLAMEDFNVLQKSEFTGEHRLIASATLFPAGWVLRERIGKSVTDLHGPVPLWKDFPDILNASYFTRLSMSSAMQRHTFFIQIQPRSNPRPLHEFLFVQHGKDFFPGLFPELRPEFVIVRRERQTFRRLPESGTVVFTVKTSVERLVDIEPEEREGLAKEIRAWPSQIASYKGRDLWGKAVYGFCEARPDDEEE